MLKGMTGATLACLAVFAASACTQSTNGTPGTPSGLPMPGATSSTLPNTAGGANTAPAISNSLDVSKFIADPCLSLTQAQASDLDLSPQGTRENNDAAATCNWRYGNSYRVGVMYLVPEAKNGLQNLYEQKTVGWYNEGYFEPTTIDGYPAVYQDGSDSRNKGQCQLSVGVNEQVFFTVVNNGPQDTDLCKGAAKAATAVMETIKRG